MTAADRAAKTRPSRQASRHHGPPEAVRKDDRLVPRVRLLDKIDRGVAGPLTVISAPAGTGKTVAAASWVDAGRAPGPVVWISLTELDGGADALWGRLVDGLQRSGVRVKRWDAGSGTPQPSELNALAAQIPDQPDPITVVLDCDVPLAKTAAAALHHLLRRAAGKLRLIVLSRADPLLPLHLYRLDDALVEIRIADLAFTAAEAEELLARRGVHLPPSVLDVVLDRTRGWVAGLQLASMSLAHCTDPASAARELTGASGTVSEYLLSEVLDAQPPAIRRLLLETSVVDVLRPGLVEALSGPHAQRAVAFLARGNAFLETVPNTIECHRYHPLFRELLYAQLGFESPAELPRLHMTAARWLSGAGYLEEAVRNAAAARHWETAAAYVVDHLAVSELLDRPGTNGVSTVFQALPKEEAGLAVTLVRAALRLARSETSRAGDEIERATHLLDGMRGDPWPAAALTEAFLDTMHAASVGDAAAVADAAKRAERMLAQNVGALAAHPELPAALFATKGAALVGMGELSAAAEAYTEAARAGTRAGFERLHADCYGHLALIAAWRGQYRKAVRLAEQARAAEAEAGLPTRLSSGAAEVALAWVRVETYDLVEAQRRAFAASETATAREDPMARVMLSLAQARIRRAHGDVDGARSVVAAERAAGAHTPDWLADRLRVETAALDAAAGEPGRTALDVRALSGAALEDAVLMRTQAKLERGADLDRPVPTPNGPSAVLPTRVDKWLLEAYRHLQRGDAQQAGDALGRSLRLAAPEQLRRPFREAPADVRRLLRTRTDLARAHRWLIGDAKSQERSAPPPSTQADGQGFLVESLTQKEQEVLGYLAELLTTEEIAGAMFVSVNTIRTHVRNILRKMAVSRRNEAIRRARELGILPQLP